MKFQDLQTVYFIGIGGAGVSGLARMAKLHGKQVSGSDIQSTAATNQLESEGITVFTGQQDTSHVPLDADLYVYSDAVQPDNPERALLIEKGLADKTMSYFAALGEFIKVYKHRIAISGTHGKTTTTAMMSLVLEHAGIDPAAIVGSTVKAWNSNVRVGKSDDYVVVEACEYKEHMRELEPNVIILNNIEEDHLDYYRDLEHITDAFQEYVAELPSNGLLVVNTDDERCRDIEFEGKTVTFAIDADADYVATNIAPRGHTQTFTVAGTKYTLHVPGHFNIYNALAVIAYCSEIGVPAKTIQAGLKQFTGTWRRFEYVGQYRDADVISDYAHHPTAIKELLTATSEWYPKQRVVIVFQPHQHNRTRRLFNGFVTAFDTAGLIILQEIYDVAGREEAEDQDVSSKDLVAQIGERGKLALYSPDRKHTLQLLSEHIEKGDVVLIVGAGDIYLVGEELVNG